MNIPDILARMRWQADEIERKAGEFPESYLEAGVILKAARSMRERADEIEAEWKRERAATEDVARELARAARGLHEGAILDSGHYVARFFDSLSARLRLQEGREPREGEK